MQFGYVLNPRIENEDLTPYKAFLADFFKERKAEFAGNPEGLARWIRQNISTEEKYCLPGVRMSPESVARQKRGDASSQKQLFVAAARSLGIPARIDPVRGEAQYADASGAWHDVLKAGEAPKGPSGHITLTYERSGHLADPGYYFHFTLSKIEDGMPRLLEYAEDATVADTFSKPLEIEAGDYVLTTGQRLANGNVLARCNFFSVAPSGSISIPLKIREDKSEVSVIGSLNAEDLYHDIAASASKSILSTTGRGYYILGLLRNGHEPSVHTLNDVSLLKDAFEKRKEKIVLLFDNEDSAHKAKEAFPNLPSNAAFGVDSNGAIAKEIRTSLNLESEELPIFVIADSFNRIVFVVQGYTIGLGDLLIKTLDKIEN